ncbi:MAG: preprotein translocase subunit SecY, partial [Phyllobacterium sp.]
VLTYAEIAKLLFPSLAKWQASSSDNAYRTSLVIKVLVLLLSAVQGYGILSALAAMGLIDGSASLIIAGITSFVGASAVMICLADMVRLPGLGNGIWFLVAIPLLGTLPREAAALVELMRFGAISATGWLILGVFIAIAIAMIALANMLLSRKDDGEANPRISSAVLLWPPFLANTIAGYLIAVPFGLFPELLSDAPWLLDGAFLALSTVLIPVFVYAYYRHFSLEQAEPLRGSGTKSILLTVGVVQVLVCVGFGILTRIHSLPSAFDGKLLIVCVTVLLAFRNAPDGSSPMQKRDLTE